MRNQLIAFVFVVSSFGMAGTAFAEEQVNFPGGAAVLSPPAENSAALLQEASEAGEAVDVLKRAAARGYPPQGLRERVGAVRSVGGKAAGTKALAGAGN